MKRCRVNEARVDGETSISLKSHDYYRGRSHDFNHGASSATRTDVGRIGVYERFPRIALDDEEESDMDTSDTKDVKTPSQHIDARIEELGDWRGELLSRIRTLIKSSVPDVVEEWKWRGVPTWYCDGMICTGETYKAVVKMTFAKGASLEDPAGLFNSSLEGNVRRAIDFHEGEEINEKALKALVRAAVALNQSAP